MMKKALALWLALLWTLLTVGSVLADEEVQAVAVDVAGITFNVPAAWDVDSEYDEEEGGFIVFARNEDETQFMVLMVYEVGDEPLETFIEEIKATEGLGGLKEAKVGDLDFVLYDYADQSNLGAFAITADGFLLLFEFGVATDPQVAAIAEQVFLSIAPI